MKITKTSTLTGITRTKDIPMSDDQYQRYVEGDELIQNIFPELDPDTREFLISGISAGEWDEAFSDIDEALENTSDED